MTARHAYEKFAGRWVAWYEHDDGRGTRIYLRRTGSVVSWTVVRAEAIRFDTRREAERNVRVLRPREYGQTTGAEKVSDA